MGLKTLVLTHLLDYVADSAVSAVPFKILLYKKFCSESDNVTRVSCSVLWNRSVRSLSFLLKYVLATSVDYNYNHIYKY